MNPLSRGKRLPKELGLLDVYAIATGSALSGGFFLLPGLAAAEVGAGLVLAYLLAAVPLVLAMFSIVELATAMPRAGGPYYFLDRTLGPMAGTIGGLGNWLAMVLKVAFALVGMGAYVALFAPDLPVTPVAAGLALAIGAVNLYGAGKTGGVQVLLVGVLLTLLAGFVVSGLWHLRLGDLAPVLHVQVRPLLGTAGMVYISYASVIKVISLSEEVTDPERNLPLGVFLAVATAVVVYGLGTAVMVAVVPAARLAGDLTPAATAAEVLHGRWGMVLISVSALLAFISVANAGTLSASRFPLAMSRDHLLPRFLQRLSGQGVPYYAVAVTVAAVLVVLIFLDATRIAKLASAFQLLMFALACIGVIVMRESRIDSYDPGYRSPLYPWMQLAGCGLSLALIAAMGWMPLLFSLSLIAVGAAWYRHYARGKVVRDGAIYHVLARLGQLRYEGLDGELRGILREKGLRQEDPFDEIVARSLVIDMPEPAEFPRVAALAAEWLAGIVPDSPQEILDRLLDRSVVGATPVTHGVALPHLRIEGLQNAEMVLVRSRHGVHISFSNPYLHDREEDHVLHAIFFLFSSEQNPTQHLRILAQIAERVDDEGFTRAWLSADDEQRIKEVLLHDDRYLALRLLPGSPAARLIDQRLGDADVPAGCVIALLRRGSQVLVPSPDTVLHEGDRLTILGGQEELAELAARYTGPGDARLPAPT